MALLGRAFDFFFQSLSSFSSPLLLSFFLGARLFELCYSVDLPLWGFSFFLFNFFCSWCKVLAPG
ncbi:hypothetical protein HDV62DRAFT_361204 [Trichoderma sp. SZMC 28011]